MSHVPEQRQLYERGAIRFLLTFTVSIGTLGGFAIVAQAHTLARLINGAFLGNQRLAAMATLLGLFAFIVLMRAALAWAADLTAHLMSYRARGHLRSRLVKRLFALGPAYFRGKRTGELVNVLTDGVESLDSYVAGYLPQKILAVTIPLLILLVVFPLDPLSGLVLLLSAPVIPVIMILIGKLSERVTQQRWNTLNWMSAHFLDVLQGLMTLKLFGRAQTQVEKVRLISNRFRIATMQVLRVAFLSSLVMELTATLSTAVVAVEIGIRLLGGGIAFEQALFVLMLTPEFYLPLRTLGVRHHAAMAAKAATSSFATILDAPLPAANATNTTRQIAAPAAWQTLAFEHVSFTYEGRDEDERDDEERGSHVALADCSFVVRRGEHVALVGPSGAGKSTIASLLLRFSEPAAGAITVDGASLTSIPAATWREQITWVPQAPYLFHTTVAENIRLGRPDATTDEIVAAAKAAQAHEFIEALPQGYETLLDERGARLSGGQIQRIALARAFLRNAPILILDEATSHLDSLSESSVLAALKGLAAGKTLITISHRRTALDTIDRALVVQGGRIIKEFAPSENRLAARSAMGSEGVA